MKKDWSVADRISDAIVDAINGELKAMQRENRHEPLQLLAGQLLAFCALQRTMPKNIPPSLAKVLSAVHECLESLLGGEDGPVPGPPPAWVNEEGHALIICKTWDGFGHLEAVPAVCELCPATISAFPSSLRQAENDAHFHLVCQDCAERLRRQGAEFRFKGRVRSPEGEPWKC